MNLHNLFITLSKKLKPVIKYLLNSCIINYFKENYLIYHNNWWNSLSLNNLLIKSYNVWNNKWIYILGNTKEKR